MFNVILQMNINKIIQNENISATLPVWFHTDFILNISVFHNCLKLKKKIYH